MTTLAILNALHAHDITVNQALALLEFYAEDTLQAHVEQACALFAQDPDEQFWAVADYLSDAHVRMTLIAARCEEPT